MKKKADTLPETLPMAALCALLSEDDRQIQRITKKAGIEIAERGNYPVAATILAVKQHYQRLADEKNPGRQADIDRKAKADADSAEIELAEKRGLLMLRADARQMWDDGHIEMRRRLQAAKDIPEKVKPAVVKILQSVRLKKDDGSDWV